MMNRSLLSLVEETSQKYDSKRRRPQYDVIDDFSSVPKMFQAKITISIFDHTLVGEGSSMKKKSAQHLAAGQVLLKITELEEWNRVFPQAKTPEEAREMINSEMEKYGRDANPSENPVVKLHNLCKECNLVDPIFEEIEAVSNSFAINCRVANTYITRGEGPNKKGAKAAAAEAMLETLNSILDKAAAQSVPKSSPRAAKEPPLDFTPVDPQLTTTMKQTEVDKILKEIQNCFASSSHGQCKSAIEQRFDSVFTRMYGKQFEWCWQSHITKDMTKFLMSVHAIDRKYSKLKEENIPREAILDSFYGMGGDFESAMNNAAKNALNRVNLWLQHQVTIINDRPEHPSSSESNSGVLTPTKMKNSSDSDA